MNLYWQALGRLPRDYTAFVHAVDAQGATPAQDDIRLRDRQGNPTSLWQAGDAARSFHRLPAGMGVAIKVGVYDLATMERLPLQGDRSGENAVEIALTR